jgi:hypothetical protein
MNLTQNEIKQKISSLRGELMNLMFSQSDDGPAQRLYQSNQEEALLEQIKQYENMLEKAKA